MHAGPLASEFFKAGSRIRVVAHTESGAPDSGMGRYAARFVQKLAGAAVGTALAFSLGASVTNAAAATSSPMDLQRLMELPAGTLTAADAAHLKIRVHDASTPALPGLLPEARYAAGVCDLTLDNLYDLRAAAPSLPDARHPQLRAEFVVLHETAHCEALAAYAGALPASQPAARAAGTQIDRLIDAAALPMDIRRNVGMLIFERQADAKALLHLAYRELSRSEAATAPAEALRRFDLYVDEALALRTTMDADHLAFDDHESAAVIREVQALVHSRVASSPSHAHTAFGPDVSGQLAMQIATNSIERDFAQIKQALLEVESASLKRALASERAENGEAEEGADLRFALAQRLEAVAAAANKVATTSSTTTPTFANGSTYERFLRKTREPSNFPSPRDFSSKSTADDIEPQASRTLPSIRLAAKLLTLLAEKHDGCCPTKQLAP